MPNYREGELAYREDGSDRAEKNNAPPRLAEIGQRLGADKKTKLSSQDLTVLEKSVRGQVSGLVGALHRNLNGASGDTDRVPDIDHRLHPELHELARQMPGMDKALSYRETFLKALIDPDPAHHRDLINELLLADIPLQTLAIHLLCPIATELGTFWCNDDADFMQVAVASTRLSNVVNHLSHAGPQTSPPASAKRILLARSRGTKHTLGVTLVRMCFQDLGWIVDGGADMEIGETMYMRLSSRPYDMLGLSIGQLEEARDCREAIDRFRSDATTRPTKIAVGGAAVLMHANEFKTIGADIVARSALEVINLADRAAV